MIKGKLEKKYYLICREAQRTRQSIVDIASTNINEKINEEEGTKTPTTTTLSRIKKLEEEGVIKGWRAILDPEWFDLTEIYLIQVSFSYWDPRKQGDMLDQIKVANEIKNKIPEAFGVFIVTGEWDIILLIRVKNTTELSELVLNKLRQIPGVSRTNTVTVMKTIEDPINHTNLEI